MDRMTMRGEGLSCFEQLKTLHYFNLTLALGKAIRLQLRKTSNSFPLGLQVSSSDTSGGSGIDLKIKTIGKHIN